MSLGITLRDEASSKPAGISVIRIGGREIIFRQLKPDTLNEENRKFDQRPLAQPLFLNSVPKSGSHLLRNIVRMFVPVEQQYDAQFIQHQIIQEHLGAFADHRNFLSWGHLLFTRRELRSRSASPANPPGSRSL